MPPPRSDRFRRSPRPGFTLLELLIVAAIIAIIALLVLPGGQRLSLERLRSAARLLIADVEYAQALSIADGANPCVIVFDVKAGEYWLARRSSPDTPLLDPGTRRLYRTRYGEGRAAQLAGVRLESADVGGDDRLEFTPLGALDQGGDAAIVLRSGDGLSRVLIDASTGEPRVEGVD